MRHLNIFLWISLVSLVAIILGALLPGCSSLSRLSTPGGEAGRSGGDAFLTGDPSGRVRYPALRMVPQTGLTGMGISARIDQGGNRILITQADRRISLWSRDGSLLFTDSGLDGVILPGEAGAAILNKAGGGYFLSRIDYQLREKYPIALDLPLPEEGLSSLLLRPESEEIYLIPEGSVTAIPSIDFDGRPGQSLTYPRPFDLVGTPAFSRDGGRCAVPVYIEYEEAPPEPAILVWSLSDRSVKKITVPSTDPMFDGEPLPFEQLALNEDGSLLAASTSQEGSFLLNLAELFGPASSGGQANSGGQASSDGQAGSADPAASAGSRALHIDDTKYVASLTWSAGLLAISTSHDTWWLDRWGNRLGRWKDRVVLAEAAERGDLLLRKGGSWELLLTDPGGQVLYRFKQRPITASHRFVLEERRQLELFHDGSFRFWNDRFEPGPIQQGFQVKQDEILGDVAYDPGNERIGAVIAGSTDADNRWSRIEVIDAQGKGLWVRDISDLVDAEPERPLRRIRFSQTGERLFFYYHGYGSREEGRIFSFDGERGISGKPFPAMKDRKNVAFQPLSGGGYAVLGQGWRMEDLDSYRLSRYDQAGKLIETRDFELEKKSNPEISDQPWAEEGIALLIREGGERSIAFRGFDPSDDLRIPLDPRLGGFTDPIPSPEADSFYLLADDYLTSLQEPVVIAVSRRGKVLSTYRGTRARTFFPPTAGRGAALFGYDGILRYYRDDSSSPLNIASDRDDWIGWTEDGLFMGSSNSDGFVKMVMKGRALGIDYFAHVMNRPDRILSRYHPDAAEAIADFEAQYRRRQEILGQSGETSEALMEKIQQAEELDRVRIESLLLEGGMASLVFALSEEGSRASTYQIYVNHVPLYEGVGEPLPEGYQASFPLTEKRNLIEVSVRDGEGLESFRASRVVFLDEPVQGDLWYVGLGSSDYLDDTLDLGFAAKDARDLDRLFSRVGKREWSGEVHRKVLTDREIEKGAIPELQEYLAESRPEDTVVLFVAGHGMYDRDLMDQGIFQYYYLPYDSDSDRLSETAIPYSDLEQLLSGIPARKRLLFIDTCESGLLTRDDASRFGISSGREDLNARGIAIVSADSSGAEQVSPASNQSQADTSATEAAGALLFPVDRNRYIFNDLLRRTGATVFSSSRAWELSWESEKLRNGLFTASLIKVLQARDAARGSTGSSTGSSAGDGAIPMELLEERVAAEVMKLSGGRQHPIIERDNLEQELVLPLAFP